MMRIMMSCPSVRAARDLLFWAALTGCHAVLLSKARIIPWVGGAVSAASRPHYSERGAYALEVLRSIHAGRRGVIGDDDADAVAVPQHAQLFERFEFFQGGQRQLRIAAQEAGAEAVDADM